ncbi:MAG: glycosyltransferase [Verrucomicrobiae bacterium]|nr:glycosyltransferase [Verrucomicrobiae bacterium]
MWPRSKPVGRTMKICDVTQFYSPYGGGVRRYIAEKQAFVRARGEDEHVLVIPGARDECIMEGPCKVHTVRSPRLDRTSRYRLLLRVGRVREILRQERPDMIELGDPYHVAWAAWMESCALKVPVVGFYHSHFPDAYLRTVKKYCGAMAHDFVQDYARAYIERLYGRLRRTLVPSPHLRDLLASWGVANAVVVRLGVDTGVFRPGDQDLGMRRELGVPEGRVCLLFVGRLAHEKGVATLLGAFRRLHAGAPGRFHLVVVGQGPLRRDVEAAARATGAVSWRGNFEDSSELARVYRAVDIFVHPGVLETFGLVTVEAQACGLPVVGIRGSYMDRLAFCGIERWARENTPAALAEAVRAMADGLSGGVGRAVAAAAAEYAWPKVFSELFAVYRQVCDEVADERRGEGRSGGAALGFAGL